MCTHDDKIFNILSQPKILIDNVFGIICMLLISTVQYSNYLLNYNHQTLKYNT